MPSTRKKWKYLRRPRKTGTTRSAASHKKAHIQVYQEKRRKKGGASSIKETLSEIMDTDGIDEKEAALIELDNTPNCLSLNMGSSSSCFSVANLSNDHYNISPFIYSGECMSFVTK